MADCTPLEMMAVVLAREIRDGEFGSPGGASAEVPLAAIRLAQLTHAPNASYVTSTSGFLCNGWGKALPPLGASTSEYRNVYGGAEAVVDWPFMMATGRDFFFAGGLQVDLFGNLNLIGVGPYPQMKLRGPGTAGIAQASALAKRYFIYMREHSPRTLVPKVAYISALGRPAPDPLRGEMGLPGGGPCLVVTPKAVLRFGARGTLELSSSHPGIDPAEVLAATPREFHPADGRQLGVTPAPTDRELHLLRERVDPSGLLRQ